MAAQSQPHPLHSFTRTIKTSPASLKLLRKPSRLIVAAKSNPRPKLGGRKLRVAVIGGGPAGSFTAESLARGGVETLLFERNPAAAKPYGGAISLCMLDEFDIPSHLVDSKATHMKIIFPSNLTVDQPQGIGSSLASENTPCVGPDERYRNAHKRKNEHSSARLPAHFLYQSSGSSDNFKELTLEFNKEGDFPSKSKLPSSNSAPAPQLSSTSCDTSHLTNLEQQLPFLLSENLRIRALYTEISTQRPLCTNLSGNFTTASSLPWPQ
ncbi:hypothetical protein RJ640_008718 [Escallonia rubra]|uniref:FAD-binding domain-containing protein n=1 Tax=Escallonia rubra TaxID=112253 RepID=A0AA88RAP6_9ASTE|nr:hypothetical protein RJ640_008718 [Escallonia rubra]